MFLSARIEGGICALYPGVAAAIRLLGDLVYEGLQGVPDEPNEQAYTCCLAWRWAHTRPVTDSLGEPEMFVRLGVSASGQRWWAKIRRLVEQAWTADDTQEVIDLAREILSNGTYHFHPPVGIVAGQLRRHPAPWRKTHPPPYRPCRLCPRPGNGFGR